ncbi:hypothetical protein NDU88_000602 [Pleurodeles waltl]|uniref:Uncharacterized protein n=1 Tax=Pleurodeles waltl TaxID=8319 RepID=A0AAV7URS3_PLEWA|nr:hypothetical protein NDU88_000602 [Pleurodeles waltl]
MVDVRTTMGTSLAKNTMKTEQPLITIPSSNGDDIISELSHRKQQLIETPKNMGITGNKGIDYQPQRTNSEGNNKDRNMQFSGTNDYALKVQSIIGEDMMCRLPDYEEEGSRKLEKGVGKGEVQGKGKTRTLT